MPDKEPTVHGRDPALSKMKHPGAAIPVKPRSAAYRGIVARRLAVPGRLADLKVVGRRLGHGISTVIVGSTTDLLVIRDYLQ
jgi:hypothetical protein